MVYSLSWEILTGVIDQVEEALMVEETGMVEEIDLMEAGEEILTRVGIGQCSKQSVANAAKSAKFLLNQPGTGLFFAGTALEIMVDQSQEGLKGLIEVMREVTQGLQILRLLPIEKSSRL